MLEIRDLAAGYGRIDVLHEISIAVPRGGIVGLMGPNGAGKTTLARSISGLTRIRGGEIQFEGTAINGWAAEDIVAAGIVHVPQGRMLFPDLTVDENLELGAYVKNARRESLQARARVRDFFPILHERRMQAAGLLSGGEQQMLAIGRALMGRPRLLMLDEPSLGLAPIIVDAIYQALRQINAGGVTILVAEQNAMKVLQTAGYVYVLENGRVAHAGSSAELAASDRIKRSYLGVVE
jgi:branched-chain amino acid transport system ATP-binding protein